ncbi:MAG: MarR family transcriptional regulator [Methylobacteriaceae bacterium]|nr:MarR family transcriptional regulator [Methylobacteriaceae bacterium]MCC0002564.1 MarR family transcriptional regulator [Methylobacteriaceae bacterium]
MRSASIALSTIHEVRDSCLCLATQRAARRLARRFDRAFKPVGLTNQQFSLLMPLNAPGPQPMVALADLMGMDRTTLTAALKALERRGLVESGRDPDDRRIRRLTLTDAGRAALEAALPIWRAEHTRIEQEITPAKAGALRAALRPIV